MGVGLSKRARRRNKRLHAFQAQVTDLKSKVDGLKYLLQVEQNGRRYDNAMAQQRADEAYRQGQSDFCRRYVDREEFVKYAMASASHKLAKEFGVELGSRVHSFWKQYDPALDYEDRMRWRELLLEYSAQHITVDTSVREPIFKDGEAPVAIQARFDMPVLNFTFTI